MRLVKLWFMEYNEAIERKSMSVCFEMKDFHNVNCEKLVEICFFFLKYICFMYVNQCVHRKVSGRTYMKLLTVDIYGK